MKIFKNPDRSKWEELLKRPLFDTESLDTKVKSILDEINNDGDKAVIEYTSQFDGVNLSAVKVTQQELETAEELVSDELKNAMTLAAYNITKFHKAQRMEDICVETTPGVSCWQRAVPIEKVGLYIPGGTAPLFSTVLMLAIPAKIAGCEKIILATPPSKDGSVHPAILVAARIVGVEEVFKMGGVQAIGAMAYGTETVPKVNKIFGPGNQWVTAAKQLVSRGDVAIDMPAGPSEVEVIADDTADPEFIASDLLSQAEHGVDSQVILVTTSEKIVKEVEKEVAKQLAELPRKDIAAKALDNSTIIVLENEKDVLDITNMYAPEHLIISTKNCDALADKVKNAGSIFIGNYTPESAGDYASGTNHTLPTNGYATVYSGVNLDAYVKKITYQKISKVGLKNIGPSIEIMAEEEELNAHKNAVTVRLKKI